jgi:hypothetical protein
MGEELGEGDGRSVRASVEEGEEEADGKTAGAAAVLEAAADVPSLSEGGTRLMANPPPATSDFDTASGCDCRSFSALTYADKRSGCEVLPFSAPDRGGGTELG